MPRRADVCLRETRLRRPGDGGPRTLVAQAVRHGVLTADQAGDTTDVLQVGAAFGLLADAADAGDPQAVEILTVAVRQIAQAIP